MRLIIETLTQVGHQEPVAPPPSELPPPKPALEPPDESKLDDELVVVESVIPVVRAA
jgi:hypothetical protein